MSSGVKVSDSCLQMFSELKLGKKIKYIVYKLNDAKTEIIVDTTSESKDYDDFLNALPEADCRWGVYDFEFDQGEGKRNKIVFIAWSPDTASIKSKMLFASSKDALRRPLVGIGAEVQATDPSEAAYESVLDKVTRK